jgi:hypothetical protein
VLKTWKVQEAVYGALVSDSTLVNMVTCVGDTIDQNTHPPYITLGESTSVPNDLLTETGSTETITIQIWTKSQAMRELKLIMVRVYQLLHRQRIDIDGVPVVACVCENSLTLREPDGEWRRGVMRFRVETFGA